MVLALILLSLCGGGALWGEIINYRFSGTVQGRENGVRFRSESDPLPGIMTVRVGDHVEGSFLLDTSVEVFPSGPPPDPEFELAESLYFKHAISEFQISINGKNLMPGDLSQKKVYFLNDRFYRKSETLHVSKDMEPQKSLQGDVVVIVAGGYLSADEYISVTLNLTDPSMKAIESFSETDIQEGNLPVELSLSAFEVAKGFVELVFYPDPSEYKGIIFNIDTFEKVDPNEEPKLRMGYYIAWPDDGKNYSLQATHAPNGEWTNVDVKLQRMEGQWVYFTELSAQSKLFRLVKQD